MLNAIDALSDLFSLSGMPDHIRSDNGPEFIAKAVQDWIAATGSKTAYITLKEASVVIEQQRSHDNTIRSHWSRGDRLSAPQVVIWPTEPSNSAPLAHPAIPKGPTIHQL